MLKKRILSIIMVLTMVIAMMPLVTVNAAISVNNGKGTILSFSNASKNSPSGSPATLTQNEELTGEPFDSAIRYIYNGTHTGANLVLALEFDKPDGIVSGDYFYLSFYYRYRTNLDGTEYDATIKSINRKKVLGDGSGVSYTSVGDVSTEWNKVEYFTTAGTHATTATNTTLRELIQIQLADKAAKACVEIAEPTLMYFGALGSDDDETQKELINTELSKSNITGIQVGTETVDLTSNPTSYSTTQILSVDDITVSTYQTGAKVEKVVTETGFKIYSYAPAYNVLLGRESVANEGLFQEYTITYQPLEVIITENNGKGTALSFLEASKNSPSGSAVTLIQNAELTDEPFDSAIRYIYNGTHSGKNLALALEFDKPDGIVLGDYFYLSFYYRYRTNLDGTEYNATITGIGRKKVLGDGSGVTYTTVGDVSTEWNKTEYFTTAGTHATNTANTTLRELIQIQLADKTTTACIEIAEPTLVYFGTLEGNALDDEELVEATLQAQLDKCDFESIKLNGIEIFESNPDGYTETVDVYSEINSPAVSCETYHGIGLTKLIANGPGKYTVISYAPSFNKLDANDTKKAEYNISVEYTDSAWYDWSFVDGDNCSVSFSLDNKAAAKDLIVILAAYRENKLVGIGVSDQYTALTGTNTGLGATIKTLKYLPDEYKVFLWNNKRKMSPWLKNKLIDCNGEFLQ